MFVNEILVNIGKLYNKSSAQNHTKEVAEKIASNLEVNIFEKCR